MRKILVFIIFALVFSPFSTWSKAIPALLDDEAEFENYESQNDTKIYDPLEKFNRKIYSFNDQFDRYFLEHVAKFYRHNVPAPARDSVGNFLTNLSLPLSFANSLLQGKVENSLATFSHFLINSTIGLGGLFNVAGEKGIRFRPEDFGQTLGHYGLGSGAYLILPILGPSSTRDFGGFMVDKTVSPIDFNLLEFGGRINLIRSEYRIALTVGYGIDKREGLINIIDGIRADSFDPYATIRSAYLQKRQTEIQN